MTKIGVVLSSGGGRGVFAHTGFMSALDDLGLEISASSGCSAGAVVGGVIASGTAVQDWAAAVSRVRTEQFWTPRSPWRLLVDMGIRQGRGLKGISDTRAATGFLGEHTKAERFEDCIYPFSAVAINLGTGEKKLFHNGPLALGMMASAAMAGFYDPVEIGGDFFTDGAFIDLAPADAICCRYELDVLLIHHVAQQNYTSDDLRRSFDEPWTIVSILDRLIYLRRPWYASGQPRSFHSCPCGCRALVVVVEPTLPELIWPLTTGGAAIASAAEAHAIAQLEPIRNTLLGNDPRTLME